MSKTGIFDPWRQTPPPADKKPPSGIEEPTPITEPQRRCIVFSSARGGLNVWVDAADNDAAGTARARVRSLFSALLAMPDAAAILSAHGITPEDVRKGTFSADSASTALRKVLVNSTTGAATIARHSVKAFVK